ncbi:MAG: hypothetical protein ABIS14_06695 [Sphingomonas sp.]
MSRLIIAIALLAAPAATLAQTSPESGASQKQAESGQPPKRIRDISLGAGQACPKAAGDEIVVCHRLDEPYRIPKSLRNEHPIPAQNQSWVNRTATMDEVGRRAGGLPDTCSPVGSGGQTGCALQAAQNWAAEKRARKAETQDQ